MVEQEITTHPVTVSTRDLITIAAPYVQTPSHASATGWMLAGAAGLSLLSILTCLPILWDPALRSALRAPAIIVQLGGLGLFCIWGLLRTCIFLFDLRHANRHLADRLDGQAARNAALVALLLASHGRADLQRRGREIAFESEMNQRFVRTTAIIGGLVTAITATIAAFPGGGWQQSDMVKAIIPAILLTTAIASVVQHGFGQRLLRLGFAISEAEREIDRT